MRKIRKVKDIGYLDQQIDIYNEAEIADSGSGAFYEGKTPFLSGVWCKFRIWKGANQDDQLQAGRDETVLYADFTVPFSSCFKVGMWILFNDFWYQIRRLDNSEYASYFMSLKCVGTKAADK